MDLVAQLASKVACPVLLIVGEKDREVLEWNQTFFRNLKTQKAFEIIPEAGHLFDEPGQLKEVGEVSLSWLLQLLSETKTTTVSIFYPTDTPNV